MLPRDLPIYELEAAVVDSLRAQGRLIVQAPTGSGKSTQIPQMLLQHGLLGEKGEVVVLQPRRLAARMLAKRVAEEHGTPLGDVVGYQIRLESRVSPQTRIRFVTEGILLRQMSFDAQLRGVSVVVFDEFQRLDRQSPWGEKGLGLGLSICDRIARLLGAKLTVSSTPARGSAFGIRIPRAAVSHARSPRLASAMEAKASIASLRSVQVLCIEDDQDILDGLVELLSRWEMRVIGVQSAEEAHDAIRHYRIDLVLADYHLHGQPIGLDLLVQLTDRITAVGPARGALITADASPALLHEARSRGFQLLRKPVRPAALRALIAALMRSSSGAEPSSARLAAHSKAGEPAA